MVSKPVWIGIVIGVFFVGIGVSYAIFQASNQPNFMAMTPQQMQQMIQDPQMRQQMMEQMNSMMNDPQQRQQMMTMMMQNQEFMQDIMNNTQMMDMMNNMMGSGGMMGSGMMDEGILKTPADDKIETTENQFSYDNEIIFKIRQAQELSTNPKVLQALISSNEEFKEIDNVQVLIDELDANWVSTEPEELTPFMVELINNDISDLLREKIRFYDEEPGDLRSVEIILTNAYGANIAITGKTSDYRQDDETWWQEAKQIGLYLAPIDYDASADVYSADIALGIYDDAKFVGVLKIVVDIETIISMGS